MNLRRLFFHDMGRKLLAFALASLVWWRFNEIITRSEVVALEVFAVERTEADVPGRLQVQAPPGWILVEPSAGSTHEVTFKGPGASIADFLADDLPSASYVASFSDPGRTTDRFQVKVPLEDLRWSQKKQALDLLTDDSWVALTFERSAERNVTLAPGMLPIDGEPAENYQVLEGLIEFDPQTVTLSGPKSAIVELVAALDPAGGAAGPPPALLEPLNVQDMRDNIQRQQKVSQALIQQGISMLPEKVRVRVPVRLENAPPVTFVPDTIYPWRQELADGDWVLEPSVSQWTAELENLPGIDLRPDQFTESWAKEHIILFVDFNEIPEGAAEYDLPVHWAVTGLSTTTRQEELLKSALIVAPKQPSDGKIRVTRESPPQ